MATLEVAASIGNIDMLYALLRVDPELLEVIDKKPFVDTPLHIAASAGRTQFALEMLLLKPSFGRKLNPDGFTPLHLALREGHTNTVKWLVNRNPELVRVPGKEGITPLHYVAEAGHDDVLAEFLMACPASIKDLTARGETAVHLSVRNRRLRALKVLYGWLYHTDNKGVLNCQDIDGNTALHLAVSTNQPEMVKLLIRRDEKTAKNSQDKTALDIAMEFPEEENRQVRKILKKHSVAKCSSLDTSQKVADFLSSNPKIYSGLIIGFDVYLDKGLSGDMRNALLVVAVLIATATYQAMLQPPKFSLADDPARAIITNPTLATNATIPSTEETFLYEFLFINSVAFGASLGMILGLIPRNIYMYLLYLSLFCLLLSYGIIGYSLSHAAAFPFVLTAFVLFMVVAETRLLLLAERYPWLRRRNFQKMMRNVVSCKYPEQLDK